MAVDMNRDRNSDLTVMTLNLRFGLADDGPNNWNLRSAAYPELMREHPSDFYAFQEVNDFQISFLSNLLPDYEFIGRRCQSPDNWQNNILFFHKRWRCLKHQHFYLSDTPDAPSQFSRSRWPRQCTLGTFSHAGHKITVINTHFDFEAEVQRKSALLICKRLEALSLEWPVVVMGDLNAGPDSSCLSVFRTCCGGFKSALAPPYEGTHHGFKGFPLGRAIDWILYQGGLDVRQAAMVTSRYCGYLPSDHFPLTAAFGWRVEQ